MRDTAMYGLGYTDLDKRACDYYPSGWDVNLLIETISGPSPQITIHKV